MKTIIPTVLITLFCLSLSANNPASIFSEDDCRETSVYANLNINAVSKVETDLTSGIWLIKGRTNQETVYQFQSHGLLEIIEVDHAGAPHYNSYMWRVEEFNDQPFLVLTSNDFKHEVLYQTLPTCQGMVLVDPVSIDQINLTYKPHGYSTLTKTQMETMLSGVWSSATYPYDLTDDFEDCGAFETIDGAYLEYEFRKDGKFVKRYGSKLVEYEEFGFYEIFAESNYMVFHVEKTPGNYEQHVARISYLDYGEMVLEQELDSDDFASFFCTDYKSITFIQ